MPCLVMERFDSRKRALLHDSFPIRHALITISFLISRTMAALAMANLRSDCFRNELATFNSNNQQLRARIRKVLASSGSTCDCY